MEVDKLEIPSEEEICIETNQKKEFPIDLKNVQKIRNKRIKMNCNTYRKLLLEEQDQLLKQQRYLQSRLQKYFDLESELKQLFSEMNDKQNLNQNTDSKEEQFKIADFVIKLQKFDE